jgi:hypothetical protein
MVTLDKGLDYLHTAFVISFKLGTFCVRVCINFPITAVKAVLSSIVNETEYIFQRVT